MKKLFTLLAALLFFYCDTGAQTTMQFTNYKIGSPSAEEFTSNNFKCINIGKGGVIWAGTQYGGLYRFDPKYKIWTKSGELTNVFINDIKMDADSGIWIGQSGVPATATAANVAGGVNFFPDPLDYGMKFYSQSGSLSDAYLWSRNVRSLYVDVATRTAGQRPRVWVAQGSSVSAGAPIRGGLSVGLNAGVPYFTKKLAGYDFSRNALPTLECVGGAANEVWVGVRLNNGKPQILRYDAFGRMLGYYDNSNVPELPNGFTPHAIFFDSWGNKWISLKSGGLVVKTPSKWIRINDVSLLPGGGLFHPNAITEDEFGSVYFGTSSGLLEYKSPDQSLTSDPENPASYKLYTTDDGLGGTQVTGLAYDKKEGRLLIATNGGVSFLQKKEKYIKGTVFNVYTEIDKDAPTPGYKKIGEKSATVKLIFDGEVKESINPDATGTFELKKAEEDKSYTVEVEFTNKKGKKMKYLYNDIKNHTLMLPTLLPDSLIGELAKFKEKMEKRCLKFSYSSIPLFDVCRDGFFITGYDDVYEPFFAAGGIDKDHTKKVDNLANYFATMKSVYEIGGHATDLTIEMMDNAWSLFDAVVGLSDFGMQANINLDIKLSKDDKVVQDAQKAMYFTVAKTMKESIIALLKTASGQLAPYPSSQKAFDAIVTGVNDGLDVAIEIADKGNLTAGGKKVFLDNLKKFISTELAATFYKVYYCRSVHEKLVASAGTAAINANSKVPFFETYQNLLSPEGNSILKFAKDTLDHTKASVAGLNNVAKVADMVAGAADAASILALVPGAQAAGAAAKLVSYFAKGVQITAITGAVIVDAMGVDEEINLSIPAKEKAGLNMRKVRNIYREQGISQKQPVKLLAEKNNYNQKITAFQSEAGLPTLNGAAFASKLNDLRLADSAYSKELSNTFNELFASADSASMYIPGFNERYRNMFDSFVSRQVTYKQALYAQQLAGLLDLENKASYKPALDSTANDLKILNDSAYNSLVRLINEINDNNIGAPAYLEQTNYQMNHTHKPGAAGSFIYTFKNFGTEEMKKVSFKINQPTEGFAITSADSIYVGSILPGETKQVSFNFSSPAATDSFTIGNFMIDVKAANGKYRNTSGSLYILKVGGALPVTLGNFAIRCSGKNNMLTWETFTESNSDHFEIEKSINGNSWITVGKISSAGNSTAKRNYQFTDKVDENYFYRLKQVDKDGRSVYSVVVKSNCSVDVPAIFVYPVPASNVLHVDIKSDKNIAVSMKLMDILGREVKTSRADLQKGINKLELHTNGLPGGQYILRVHGTDINQSIKVMVGK